MLKGQFTEKLIPDESCIMGVSSDGKPHRFCVGNEQGEILPKFLMGQRTRASNLLPASACTCYIASTYPRTPDGQPPLNSMYDLQQSLSSSSRAKSLAVP
jgi:hypothetical protein